MKLDYYYQVLGLTPSASIKEVKRAFNKLAHRYHPDLSGDPTLGKKYRQILQAYQHIKKYNKELIQEPGFNEAGARYQAYQSVYQRQGALKQPAQTKKAKKRVNKQPKYGLKETLSGLLRPIGQFFDYLFEEEDIQEQIRKEKRAYHELKASSALIKPAPVESSTVDNKKKKIDIYI